MWKPPRRPPNARRTSRSFCSRAISSSTGAMGAMLQPILAAVTAQATWELVNKNQAGLFHVAGGERLSRLQIGQVIAARWPQLNPKFEAASAKDYPGAPRPADSSLNCAKAQKLLSFPLPGLTEWLTAHSNEAF